MAYGDLSRGTPSELLGPITPDAIAIPKPNFALIMRRPEDQCVLTLGFWNMTVDFTKTPPVVKSLNTSKTNYLTISPGVIGADFPAGVSSPAPQNVAEQAFPLVASGVSSQKNAPIKAPSSATSVGDPAVKARVEPFIDIDPTYTTRIALVVPNSLVAPDATTPWTLDTDLLLSWVDLQLSVVRNALPPGIAVSQVPRGVKAPVKPTLTQTAIEMPYRLLLSPPAIAEAAPLHGIDLNPSTTVFTNATQPVTHSGWTELWHTRMAVRRTIFVVGPTDRAKANQPDIQIGHDETIIDETDRDLMTVRAVWCTDPAFSGDMASDADPLPDDNLPGFTSSLRYQDRYDIVRLSSDFTPSPKGPLGRTGTSSDKPKITSEFVPAPATVDRLMLTSLGGWLDCDAHWNLPHQEVSHKKTYNSSLLSWRHRAVQGRDSYVRVVRKGYLFPWGHLASLVTITEREFAEKDKRSGAYLRQKIFIVVAGPIKTYGGSGDFAKYEGHEIPFTTVEALTLVSPDIQEGKSPPEPYTDKQGGVAELCFQPDLSTGKPFLFHLRGTDWAGAPIDFHSPVVWVDDTWAYGDGATHQKFMAKLISNWNAKRPTIELHNQRVSLALPTDPTGPSDTQLVLASFVLGADTPVSGTGSQSLINNSKPAFYPSMFSVSVNSPEASAASGKAVGASVMEYSKTNYLNHGGFSNGKPGEVFLSHVKTEKRQAIVFSSDHSGGSITPNLGIDGISRTLGPVSGNGSVDNAADGVFHAKDIFPTSGPNAIHAKLLGGIDLATIIGLVKFGDGGTPSQVPTVTTAELQGPHRIVTTVDWHPTIQSGGPPGAAHLFDPDDDPSDDSMDLHAVIVTSLESNVPSTSTVSGQIRNFSLNLYGNDDDSGTHFITIPFDSLTFRAQTGQKTDVQVQVNSDGVAFAGPLSFVQDLASYLAFDGSGLTINTAGSAITADLTLAIPNITCGVFALDNIAFSAGVAIPYNGDPVVFNFAFCSADNPFQLEIMIFTGGGFVALTIGPNGVQSFSVSFDFGLGYSIDIGVASGQVSLVGGISYSSTQLQPHGQEVDLTAYVKASGGVSCLGVISVSVELYLGLTYQGPPSELIGEASMSISVHILFFGFSVGIDVQETFGGSGSGSSSDLAHLHHGVNRPAAIAKAADATPPPNTPNTFGGSLTQPQWVDYCSSFALV